MFLQAGCPFCYFTIDVETLKVTQCTHPSQWPDFIVSLSATRILRAHLSDLIRHFWLGIRKSISDEMLLWLSVCNEVQIVSIWSSWCHCHLITASSLASFKSSLVSSFCYWFTQVVLEKRPLNRCRNVSGNSVCYYPCVLLWPLVSPMNSGPAAGHITSILANDRLTLSACVSFCLPACLSVYLCVRVCVCLCLSLCLPVCLSVCLSACVSVCVCVCLCLSVRPSVCHTYTCICQCLCVCLCLAGTLTRWLLSTWPLVRKTKRAFLPMTSAVHCLTSLSPASAGW